ncbi:MAG: hypothetical protein L6R30_08210 [Thermoanaerobaculia bacterium]|nr:hypothetical protein [Thermoanaerobaculia bacterium]
MFLRRTDVQGCPGRSGTFQRNSVSAAAVKDEEGQTSPGALYRLLRYGIEYVEAGQKAYEERFMNRQIHNLKLRASTLGFTLVPTAPAASVS